MYSCREASERASRAMEEPLPRMQRAQLWLHLAMCRGCHNFSRQIEFLRLASRKSPKMFDRDEG
ncbi:MAG: hypothetical protein A3H32_04860 [Betaproteobacteria bacterium RIFCSPLOWO2_02_FULL_63_19]|nr:MAG: hypothetical protein A3H32_04860 [Betaproteobacteria bacterium RIFCSPLOWO2_02_FULL_63_19]